MSWRKIFAPSAFPSFGDVPIPLSFPARVDATAVPWPWLQSLIEYGSHVGAPPGGHVSCPVRTPMSTYRTTLRRVMFRVLVIGSTRDVGREIAAHGTAL